METVPSEATAEPPVVKDAAYWRERRIKAFKAVEHPCAELGRVSTSCSAAMGEAAPKICQQAYRDYRTCMQEEKNKKKQQQ